MHRVVDAMNVIGSRPDGWWHDRIGAIEHLVARLDRWAEVRGERVTAMLESPPQRLPEVERVVVEWAPRAGANSADAEIVRRLPDWLAEGDQIVVVTSDRDLAARVREAGATVEPSRPFRDELDAL
jgi:predicted RNA-binding protein with PIN domain